MTQTTTLNPQICFDTPTGRVCLPIGSTGPTVPPRQESSLSVGDRLIISESAQHLRRVLEFEAIMVETLGNDDENRQVSRQQLARILADEADMMLTKAESALLRAGPYLSRFAEDISRTIASACRNEALHKELRDYLETWCRQHTDLAAHIAGLPKAASASLVRYREVIHTALDDFSAGKPPTVQITCEGSKGGCAILGFLTGAAAATGNVGAAAAGVAGIAWCCT